MVYPISSAVLAVDPDGSTLSVSSDGVKVSGDGITGTNLIHLHLVMV